MRVCLVSESWAPRIDGVAVSIEVLLRAAIEASDSGVTFSAVAPTGSFEKSGVPMRCVRSLRSPYDGYPIALTTRARTRRLLEQLDPEVIHVHTQGLLGVTALLAANDLDVPVVTSMHTDLQSYSSRYPSAGFCAPLMALAAREASIAWPPTPSGAAAALVELFVGRSTAVITPSEKMAEKLRGQTSADHLTVVPTPRSLSRSGVPNPPDARRHFGLSPGGVVVTYLGRLAKEKDVELVLHALSCGGGGLDRCELIVAGPGDQRRRLERTARREGLSDRVRFLGSLNEDEVRAVLSVTDVLALPSLTDTQSLALLEAASMGIPLVVRDERLAVGESVVRHERSGLVGASSEDFIAALRRMVESRALRRMCGAFAMEQAHLVGADYFPRILRVYERASASSGDDKRTIEKGEGRPLRRRKAPRRRKDRELGL